MVEQRLLDLKKKMSRHRPAFKRSKSEHFPSLQGRGWRKPRGTKSKLKLKLRGKPAVVLVGYRSPSKVRYLNRQGLLEVRVFGLVDLKKLDNKVCCVVVAKGVGNKLRAKIIEEAEKLKLVVVNKEPKQRKNKQGGDE